MIDTSDLVGKPFEPRGEGPEAYDCYGLLRECWRRWHGVELPNVPYAPEIALSAHRAAREALVAEGVRQWRKTEIAAGAALLLSAAGWGAHIGFALSLDRMIHAATDQVKIERIGARRRVIGAYVYD